jgi:molybdopterin biosynthesis enzyme MoaB
VNLPGSPKGAVESLDAIAALLPHAAEVLRGARHD